jgi:hypothetical protein
MRKPTPRTYAFTTMYLGLGATLAGNAATADSPVGMALAAFPALGLFFTFEMTMRNTSTAKRTRLQVAKTLVPALALMALAAYLSVGHLVELAHRYGATGGEAWALALLPDAMMLLAAVVIKDNPVRPAARKRAATTRKAKPSPIEADAPLSTPRRRRTTAATA